MTMMPNRSAARLFSVASVVAAASTFCLAQASPEPILKIDGVSVESYLASATSAQDCEPMLAHRGTGLDGSLRLQAPFGWVVNGNPFHEDWNDNAWYEGVLLHSGRYSPTYIDISLPAPGFRWTVGRTYHIQGEGSFSASDGYQGYNWQQFSQPEVVTVENVGGVAAADYIYLVYGADRFLEFKRLDATSDVYRGINGAAGAFEMTSSGSHDLLVYWDQHGTRSTFFDPNDTDNEVSGGEDGRGQLWKIEDAAGNVAYVGDETTPATAISNGYDDASRIQVAYDTADRKYEYSYTTLNETGGGTGTGTFLTTVEAFVSDGGSGWNTTGVKVEYDYATGPVGDKHTFGDLVEAKRFEPLSGFDWEVPAAKTISRTSQYKYGTDPANEHWMTHYYSPEGVRRFAEAHSDMTPIDFIGGGTNPWLYPDRTFGHFEAASDGNDLDGRIETLNVPGRFTERTQPTYLYYEAYTTFDPTADTYDPHHARLTFVRPRGTLGTVKFLQYFDEAGQPLTRANNAFFTVSGNSSASYTTSQSDRPTFWMYVSRDASDITGGVDGMVAMIATPRAVSAGDTNPTTGMNVPPCTLYDVPGTDKRHRIDTFPRDTATSSAFYGFAESESWQNGSAPTDDEDLPKPYVEFDYTTPVRDSEACVEIAGEYLLIRPLLSNVRLAPTVDYSVSPNTYTTNETTYSYEYHAEDVGGGGTTSASDPLWLCPRLTTTTLPAVSTAQLGSGVAATTLMYEREDGTAVYYRDEVETFGYFAIENGLLIKEIEDADLSETSDFVSGEAPADYMDTVPSTTGAFHNISSRTRDELGRETSLTRATGRVQESHYTQLSTGDLVRLTSAKSDSGTHHGPARYVAYDHDRNMVFDGTIAFSGGTTTTALSGWIDDAEDNPFDALDVGTLGSATSSVYNQSGTVKWSNRVYNSVPASGAGVRHYDYDEHVYVYGHENRLIFDAKMNGTTTKYELDEYGAVEAIIYGGYDPGDGFSSTQTVSDPPNEPGDDGTVGEKMFCCTLLVGADGWPFGVICTGPPTVQGGSGANDVYHASQANIYGQMVYEYHKHDLVDTFREYDNLGRLIRVGKYSDAPTDFGNYVKPAEATRLNPDIFDGFDDRFDTPFNIASNRVGLIEYEYNARGWVSRVRTYNINQTNGQIVGGSGSEEFIETAYAYDAAGRVIYMNDGRPTKIVRDRLGREITRYEIGINDDLLTDYSDFDDVSGDIVVEQTQLIREPETGNITHVIRVDRYDPASGGTEVFGSKDQNDYSDPGDFDVTPSNLDGRAQITGYDHDVLDRITARHVYGTAGTDDGITTFDSQTPPTDVLTTSVTRDDAGRVTEIEDPLGRVQKRSYDLAGKLTETIDNFDATSGAGSTLDDINRRIGYEYADTQLSKYIAYTDPDDLDEKQVTTYIWDHDVVGLGDPNTTREFVRKIEYPDGESETFIYDRYGTMREMTDRHGTLISIDVNNEERPSLVSFSLPSGSDMAQSGSDTIEISYNERGLLSQVSNVRANGGWDRDTVEFEYDGYGNLTSFKQDVPWYAKTGSGYLGLTNVDELSFDYEWERSATSGPSHIRLDENTYPDATTLAYNYTGGSNGVLSRVGSMTYDGTNVASYAYLGMNRVDTTTYGENDVYSTLRDSAGDYDAMDRFNRVTRSRWNRTRATGNSANEVPFYDTTVIWDDGSNVTGVTDHVFDSDFNFVYTNDALDRLTRVKRGDGDGSAITGLIEQEDWVLTKVGNWDSHDLDLNGDLDYSDTGEFEADGGFSSINEQTDLDLEWDSTNPGYEAEHDREYDDNGNLTLDPAKNHRYKWDVLGRLIEIHDTSVSPEELIAEFQYNALGYRIGEHIDTDADGDVDEHDDWTRFVYDARWRIVAAYLVDVSADEERITERHVHHGSGFDGLGTASYIDAVVLRDRDTTGNGLLDERHYYCQSWRADVVAIVDSSGNQIEQTRYSAYGVPWSVPFADSNRDGTLNFLDLAAMAGAFSGAYDVRFDANLDGALNFFDAVAHTAQYNLLTTNAVIGRRVLSSYGHDRGYAGYWHVEATDGLAHVRNRWYDPELGVWLSPDPLSYVDGASLFGYVGQYAIVSFDPYGLDGYKVTVFLKQPEPGTRKVMGRNGSGHVWVEVKDKDDDRVIITNGLYPNDQRDAIEDPLAPIPGQVNDDSIRDDSNIGVEYEINETDGWWLIAELLIDRLRPPDYDVDDYNCVNYAADKVDEIDPEFPVTAEPLFPGGPSIPSPGPTGEDLVETGKGVRLP